MNTFRTIVWVALFAIAACSSSSVRPSREPGSTESLPLLQNFSPKLGSKLKSLETLTGVTEVNEKDKEFSIEVLPDSFKPGGKIRLSLAGQDPIDLLLSNYVTTYPTAPDQALDTLGFAYKVGGSGAPYSGLTLYFNEYDIGGGTDGDSVAFTNIQNERAYEKTSIFHYRKLQLL